jgi:hypothetical protein
MRAPMGRASTSRAFRYLALVGAITLASCNAEHALAPEPSPQIPRIISAGSGNGSLGGVDALRAQLTWLRSLASQPGADERIAIGASDGRALSLTEYLASLEAELRIATAAPAQNAGMLPNFDIVDETKVQGYSVIYGSSYRSGTTQRDVTFSATTSCWAYNSDTEARFEADLKLAFHGVVFWSYPGFTSGGIQYTTSQYYITQTGDPVDATMRTRHICIPGGWSDRYYRFTNAAARV